MSKITQFIMKNLISFDYILGFFPCVAVYLMTSLFSRPKDDAEFCRRSLLIQAIVCPLTFALLVAILNLYFINNLITTLITVAYTYLVIFIHYTEDEFIEIANYGNKYGIKGHSKKLKIIKLISFWISYLIFYLILPSPK